MKIHYAIAIALAPLIAFTNGNANVGGQNVQLPANISDNNESQDLSNKYSTSASIDRKAHFNNKKNNDDKKNFYRELSEFINAAPDIVVSTKDIARGERIYICDDRKRDVEPSLITSKEKDVESDLYVESNALKIKDLSLGIIDSISFSGRQKFLSELHAVNSNHRNFQNSQIYKMIASGARAKHNIPKWSLLSQSNISPITPLMNNSSVNIVFKDGSMTISMPGTLMENGYDGKNVSVYSKITGKTLRGELRGDNVYISR